MPTGSVDPLGLADDDSTVGGFKFKPMGVGEHRGPGGAVIKPHIDVWEGGKWVGSIWPDGTFRKGDRRKIARATRAYLKGLGKGKLEGLKADMLRKHGVVLPAALAGILLGLLTEHAAALETVAEDYDRLIAAILAGNLARADEIADEIAAKLMEGSLYHAGLNFQVAWYNVILPKLTEQLRLKRQAEAKRKKEDQESQGSKCRIGP